MALIVHCCRTTQTIFGDDEFPMEMSKMTRTLGRYKCSVCGHKDGLMMGPYKGELDPPRPK